MLIDLHAHSALSKCCKIDGKDNLIISKEVGIDGLVLTNHYDKKYLINDDKLEFAKRYINEYYYVKSCADKLGLKAFFGIEVTMSKNDNVHVLVYGVQPEFLLKYPDLYDYKLEDLFNLVHMNNGILVQAHPFRNNIDMLQDLNYLDGIEANCHTKKEGPQLEKVFRIAYENNKLLTCGGDFHNDAPRAKCGIYLPNNIEDIKDIVKYLKEEKQYKLCVQLGKELSTVIDFTYNKN